MNFLPALLWMSASSLGFAVMTALVKALSTELTPFWLVALRAAITSLVFLVLLLFRRQNLFPRNGMRLLVFRGFAGFGGLSCLFYGATHLPLAVATLLNWSSLIFVLIFSAIFLKEKMKRRSLAWVAVAVVGLALLVVPKMEGYRLAPFAVAVGILGAIFSAMSMTAVRAASTRFSPELIIFYFSFLAAVLSLPVAFSESGLGDVVGVIFSSPTRISLVLALGISGSVAQYAMTRGYSLVSAGIGGSMSLLTAAFSALIGWWFFDERLAWVQWVGVFLLATGVVLAGASGAFERRSRAGTLAQTPEIS